MLTAAQKLAARQLEQQQISQFIVANGVTKPDGLKCASLSTLTQEAIETSTLPGERTFRAPVSSHGMVSTYASILILLQQATNVLARDLPISAGQLSQYLIHYNLIGKPKQRNTPYYLTEEGKAYLEKWLPIIIDTIIEQKTDKQYLSAKLEVNLLIDRYVIPYLNKLIEARKAELKATGDVLNTGFGNQKTKQRYQIVITLASGKETVIHKDIEDKADAQELVRMLLDAGAKVSFEVV